MTHSRYLRGGRPKIAKAPKTVRTRRSFTVTVKGGARGVKSVVLVRNNSNTHVIDADQRNVELRILRRRGDRVTVAAPPNGNVTPPGPYMLFVNRASTGGLVPSVAKQVMVTSG